MKLVKCYVSAFGTLKNFSYDFSSGLNTVKEDNGWGKSTFATFIKSMFYGLNDSKRSISENERLKFKPWNSTQKFGGYVCFEWGGKQFKLERFFGNKESEDTVRLFDVETGKEYQNTENLGKRIFEIDEEGFLSTTYFSQKDFQVKSNTSITAKFNAVCEVQDSAAFDRALLKIEDKAKTYKYRGERGLIPDAKREIHALDEELLRAEKSVATMNALKTEVNVITSEISDLEKNEKDLATRIERAGRAEATAIKKSRYNQLVKEKQKLNETLETARDVLNGNAVDKTQIEYLQNKNRELFGIDAQIETVKADLAAFSKEPEPQPDNKSPLNIIVYAVTAAIFVITLILRLSLGFLPLVTVLYVLCGVCAVLSIVVTFIKFKSTKSKVNFGLFEIINAKERALTELVAKKTTTENEVDGFIGRFNLGQGFDRATALNNILRVWEVKAEVLVKLNEIEKEFDGLKGVIEVSGGTERYEDIELLKNQHATVTNQLKQKVRDLESKRSSIRFYEDLASSFPELEGRKAELHEKITEYEEKQNVLNLTAKFLKQADENLKIKYRTPLKNSLKKYFDFVNGGNNPVNIDIDLKVTVEENGEQKSTDYYSKGYQNLFEICKRFALVDVLFTGEKPFIILDDPFYNLDDCKLSSAITLIKKLSEEYQILYLICHDSRRA